MHAFIAFDGFIALPLILEARPHDFEKGLFVALQGLGATSLTRESQVCPQNVRLRQPRNAADSLAKIGFHLLEETLDCGCVGPRTRPSRKLAVNIDEETDSQDNQENVILQEFL